MVEVVVMKMEVVEVVVVCMNNELSFISLSSAGEVDDDRSEIKTLQFSLNINGYQHCLLKVN